ncbi:MAG: AAA family ATPase [Pseudomonadota bacterium]
MNAKTDNTQEFLPPVWFEELGSSLSIRSHFALSGNVRDLFPVIGANGVVFVSFETAVWQVLKRRGYALMLRHDPVEGLRLHADCDQRYEEILRDMGYPLGQVAQTPAALQGMLAPIIADGRLPIGVLVDYTSSMMHHPRTEVEHMFVAMDKVARAPAPNRPKSAKPMPRRNPILWIVDRPGDMPEWFVTNNAATRDLWIGLPDLGDRLAFLGSLAGHLHDHATLDAATRQEKLEAMAVKTESLTLVDLRSIVQLARSEKMGVVGLEDALRSYRIGTTRNPWTSRVMRGRIRNAREVLENRVKGQPRALDKTIDIMIRSIMGLSGAQTSSRGNRPRGVLFFVGPTGTGKTELAKSITEVMFGDETAMCRFDMSEFMGDEAINRLIGPPVGTPGYQAGGELVNTVRAKPFAVYLFDEIEKANPRIMDAFLQILDDGRLSDTRGETGFFSEALIIFTSNIGMVGGDKTANSGQNVLPSDSREVLEEKLVRAVADHFRYNLKRPELFNRMGQNIVPFEFINPRSAVVIFDGVLRRVIAAVEEMHGVTVTLEDYARAQLLELCTTELNDGGRGIGNRVETYFINPLSRLLFREDGAEELRIAELRQDGSDYELVPLRDDDAEAETASAAGK